jgi:hypothetical protein
MVIDRDGSVAVFILRLMDAFTLPRVVEDDILSFVMRSDRLVEVGLSWLCLCLCLGALLFDFALFVVCPWAQYSVDASHT